MEGIRGQYGKESGDARVLFDMSMIGSEDTLILKTS